MPRAPMNQSGPLNGVESEGVDTEVLIGLELGELSS